MHIKYLKSLLVKYIQNNTSKKPSTSNIGAMPKKRKIHPMINFRIQFFLKIQRNQVKITKKIKKHAIKNLWGFDHACKVKMKNIGTIKLINTKIVGIRNHLSDFDKKSLLVWDILFFNGRPQKSTFSHSSFSSGDWFISSIYRTPLLIRLFVNPSHQYGYDLI